MRKNGTGLKGRPQAPLLKHKSPPLCSSRTRAALQAARDVLVNESCPKMQLMAESLDRDIRRLEGCEVALPGG
jgi:hypothetical protein